MILSDFVTFINNNISHVSQEVINFLSDKLILILGHKISLKIELYILRPLYCFISCLFFSLIYYSSWYSNITH